MSNILTKIKIHRLEWLGDVVRTDSERTVKKLMEGKNRRRKNKRRPRLRWMDDVELDFRDVGVK